MFLFEVTDALNKAKVDYVLVGGYAMGLHGIVRATIDVDIVLNLRLRDFQLAEEALSSVGLKSRLPVAAKDIIEMRNEFIENRNLIAWSFVDYSNPTRVVDILITHDARRIESKDIKVGNRRIKVAKLEEIFKMKKAAGRPQDLVDLARIGEALGKKTD